MKKLTLLSLTLLSVALLALVHVVQCELRADEASNSPVVENSDQKPKAPLSAAELRDKQARGKLEKKIEAHFHRSKFVKGKDRPHIDDYFVVATFQMPLATREAELRFEVMQGQQPSTTKLADYLISTPADQVRDFQVLTRFKSPEEAAQGVEFVRKQYDEFKEYQARMMESMRQATSMRRC